MKFIFRRPYCGSMGWTGQFFQSRTTDFRAAVTWAWFEGFVVSGSWNLGEPWCFRLDYDDLEVDGDDTQRII